MLLAKHEKTTAGDTFILESVSIRMLLAKHEKLIHHSENISVSVSIRMLLAKHEKAYRWNASRTMGFNPHASCEA